MTPKKLGFNLQKGLHLALTVLFIVFMASLVELIPNPLSMWLKKHKLQF